MKDLFLYFFSYIVIYYIVSRGGFDYRFLYLFIVLTLLWYLLKNPATVTYIPHKMIINVYGEGTKHGTALLGTALMLPALYVCYMRWHLALRLRWTDIVCLIGGVFYILLIVTQCCSGSTCHHTYARRQLEWIEEMAHLDPFLGI